MTRRNSSLQELLILFLIYFTFALEASLLDQMFIFRTISQPRTLSGDIPAAGRGLFTKVVYHLHGKTGWSTVSTNGKRKSPMKNFDQDWRVPYAQPLLNDTWHASKLEYGLELVKIPNGKHIFRSEIWTTFQDVPKILENFRSGTPK